MSRKPLESSLGIVTDLNWDVEKLTLSNKYGEIEDYSNIVRNDNHKTLSIMGGNYQPMSNAEFKKNVEDLSKLSSYPIEGYSEYRDGRIVLAFLKNNGTLTEINGFPIQDYFLVGNSFDGSNSFFVGTTTVFLRCTNQFSKISKLIKIKHTVNSAEKIQELHSYLKIFTNEKKEMFSNFDKFSKKILTPKMKKDMVGFVMGLNMKEVLDPSLISTKKMNQIILMNDVIKEETSEVGETVWGLFNGITKYTTHNMKSKDSIFGSPFGNPSKMNNKAYEAALHLVEN